MRAPRDPARLPRLRWLQVVFAGLDHLDDDPPWRHGLIVTNAKGVYAVPIAEYVTSMILRIHQPIDRWTTDQQARHWPPADERPEARVVRGRAAVVVGYGSIGREVARQLAALGMRIVAVKPRPDVRADDAFRVPGSGDPDGSIPERIVGVDGLEAAVGAADVGDPDAAVDRGLARDRRSTPAGGHGPRGVAHQRLARRSRRRARPDRRAARRTPGRAPSSTSRRASRCRPTTRCGRPRTSSSRRTCRVRGCPTSMTSWSTMSVATSPANRSSTGSTPSADTRRRRDRS